MEATWMFCRQGILSQDLYETTLETSRNLGVKPLEALVISGVMDPAVAAASVAETAVTPCWTEWPSFTVEEGVRLMVPPEVAFEHRCVPIRADEDGDLIVAMADPIDEEACREIEFFANARIHRVTVTAPMASLAIHQLYDIETPFLSLWRGITQEHREVAGQYGAM